VKFIDRVLEAHPFHRVPALDVDDQHATTCDSIFFRQTVVERQPGKRLAAARPRQSDDGVTADEGETPCITGTKAHRCERTIHQNDHATPTGPGTPQPNLTVGNS